MSDQDLLALYNYDSFTPEKFTPWMNFEKSSEVGSQALDFPLWDMERNETSLSQIWSQNLYTVVEFGSFT
jgi:hypothetical protein